MPFNGREGLGAPAPPLALPSPAGPTRSLQEFQGRKVVLSFLGPANCIICRGHVIRMIQAQKDFEVAGSDVVFVAYHDPELLTAKLFHSLAVPYLLLLDLERQAYSRWGLGRANWKMLFSPKMYYSLGKAMIEQKPMGNVPNANQLGGDFVIDPAGRLSFINRMRNIHDRAPVSRLLEAARRA